MSWTNILTWTGAVAGGLTGVYLAGRKVYDDWTLRALQRRTFDTQQEAARAKIEVFRQREAAKTIQHIKADDNRRLGLVLYPNGTIVLPDTGAVLGPGGVQVPPMPSVERWDWQERVLGALPNRAGGGTVPETISELSPAALPQLPRQVSIQDALGMSTPSLDRLVLGVTLNEQGRVVPITRSLCQLMHLLAIGITGSGKSTWLLSFLAQIEMCKEEVEVILIDVHGSAFNLASDWSRLRYPIARNNDEAKLVLHEVFVEAERRSLLYQQVPMAEDLASYNRYAGEADLEQLVPWLIVIDEGTLMLADSSIAGSVASAVQGTRQYGLYVFMTGQTGNAKVIQSPIRSNFPTRVCYATERPSMQAALGAVPDGELEDIPGRGWARLKGRLDPYMIQAPYIRREQFYKLIEHEGPRNQMPEAPEDGREWTRAYLQETWNNLPSKTKSAMCRALGKATGGQDWGEVDEAGKWAGLWE